MCTSTHSMTHAQTDTHIWEGTRAHIQPGPGDVETRCSYFFGHSSFFPFHLTFCRWSQFSRGKHTHAALGSLPGGCEPCMNAQIRPPAQGTTAHTHSQHTLHSKTSARLLPRAHRSRTGVCRAIGHTDAHLKHAHACLRLHAVANRQEGQHLLATH